MIEAMLDVPAGTRSRTQREIAERLGIPERQVSRLARSAQAKILARLNEFDYDYIDLREHA